MRKSLTDELNDLRKSVQDTSDRIDDVMNNEIPLLHDKFTNLALMLAIQTLDIDVHRRKWNLVIHGIKGNAAEPESVTRGKCVKFAKDDLQIPDAEQHRYAACHRLRRSPDAAIIIRFSDLKDRNQWLGHAKNLQQNNPSVSLSVDMPPILRPLKTELLNIRKNLQPQVKKETKVKHLVSWPYVELIMPGNQDPKHPSATKETIVQNLLDKYVV